MKRSKQAKKRCLEIIKEHFNNADWLYTEFVHEDNPKHLSHLDYMLFNFFETFFHNSKLKESKVMRLAPLFCRIAFNECNFQQDNTDFNKLNAISIVIQKLYTLDASGKIDLTEYKIGSSLYDEIESSILDSLNVMDDADEDVKPTFDIDTSEYDVLGPLSYEQAKEIGEYSFPECKLCFIESEHTWNKYTMSDTRAAYCILHKDYKNIPPVHDDEKKQSPYDRYGLSMVFVFVDPLNNVSVSCVRWNHHAEFPISRSVDFALAKYDICKIFGLIFENTFKPNRVVSENLIKKAKELHTGFNEQVHTINIDFFGNNVLIYVSQKNSAFGDSNVTFFKNGDENEYMIFSHLSRTKHFCMAYTKDFNKCTLIDKNGDIMFGKDAKIAPDRNDVCIGVIMPDGRETCLLRDTGTCPFGEEHMWDYKFIESFLDDNKTGKYVIAREKKTGKIKIFSKDGEYKTFDDEIINAYIIDKANGDSLIVVTRKDGKSNILSSKDENKVILPEWVQFKPPTRNWFCFMTSTVFTIKDEETNKIGVLDCEKEKLIGDKWFIDEYTASTCITVQREDKKWALITDKSEMVDEWFDNIATVSIVDYEWIAKNGNTLYQYKKDINRFVEVGTINPNVCTFI